MHMSPYIGRWIMVAMYSAWGLAMPALVILSIPELLTEMDPLKPLVASGMALFFIIIAGGGLASALQGSDSNLFFTTPLTRRLFYLQHLRRAWPIFVATLVGAPIAAWALWNFAVAIEDRTRFQWNPATVACITAMYYVVLLVLPTLFVTIDDHLTNNRDLSPRAARIALALCAGLVPVGFAIFFFWDRLLATVRDTLSALFHSGVAGQTIVGFFSPISLLSPPDGIESSVTAPLILTALWLALIAFEIYVIFWKTTPLTPPSWKPASPLLSADTKGEATQDAATSIIRQDPFIVKHFTRSPEEVDWQPYDSASAPERLFARGLFCVLPAPRDLFVRALLFKYPWLALLLLATIGLAATQWFSNSETIAGMGIYVLIGAVFVNFYQGIRWMYALRFGMSMPLRITHVMRETLRVRLSYGVTTDAFASVLIVWGLHLAAWETVPLFASFQLLRVCGQFRAYFSLLYAIGRKAASWLYEAPLFAAPPILLVASTWPRDNGKNLIDESMLTPIVFSVAVVWCCYGFFLLRILYGHTDNSLLRLTTSYRRAGTNEPI